VSRPESQKINTQRCIAGPSPWQRLNLPTLMKNSPFTHKQRLSLEDEFLIGIIGLLALMLYGVWRYPASLSQSGRLSFLATAAALLAYSVAGLWARRQSSPSFQIALEQGVKIGLLLAVAAILNHTLEIFANLD